MTSQIASLRVGYRRDSEFVAEPRPRVSWVVTTDESDWHQRRAELRLDNGATVTVEGEQNAFVAWPFEPVEPHAAHTLAVRVEGPDGWTSWSEPLSITLAALPDGGWLAPFIGLAEPAAAAQPVLFRRTIDIDDGLERAVVHLSALGAARLRIDGTVVNTGELGPGWSSYADRVLHDTADVTDVLGPGQHIIDIELTGAWYTEEYGFGAEGKRAWGEQPAVALQLHLQHRSGATHVVTTGPEWESAPHPTIQSSGLYAGELVDARGASMDHPWAPSVVHPFSIAPTPRMSEPVRAVDEVRVHSVSTSPSGARILDFGQNLVGRLRVTLTAPRGTRLVVTHAEVLDGGELAREPLRRAAATDEFVLAGTGEPETFEPFGTFHGFRYAQIEGLPDGHEVDDIVAVVLQSDMTRTGWFDTSHPLLSRLHENVVWGMRGNFLSVPSDCPQRDERLGWTGDAQIFAPTASTLFDCNGFLRSWLVDLAHDQRRHHGVVPLVVPDALGFPAAPTAAWGDAATVVPSVLDHRFADSDVLASQYDSMRAWVEVVIGDMSDAGLWESRMQLGDWLDPDAPADQPGASKTDKDIVATAYLFRSLSIVADAADRLDKSDDAARYRALADRVAQAFRDAFVTPAGRMSSDAPTAYALALEFGIVTDSTVRQALGDRLAALVRRRAYRISTGFVGTPLLLDALVSTGHTSAAARLLLETGCPSWLYPVTMGATTVWERWDSLREDGSINPGEMTSFNHYAFGAVADWMHRRLAGVAPADRGYRRIRFAPVVLPGVPSAFSTIDTVSGRVSGGWTRDGDAVIVQLSVPAHSRAVVELPAGDHVEVGPGEYQWTLPAVPEAAPTSDVSLMSSMRDVVDDQEAFDAVLDALREVDPALPSKVATEADWNSTSPFIGSMFSLPPSSIGAIAGAFAAIAARRS